MLSWPLRKAGIREDTPRIESALVAGNGVERLELWIADERPRAFIKAIYVGPGDGYNWTEHEEMYCRLSDLPEELRQQVHEALAKKLVPEFDLRQKENG